MGDVGNDFRASAAAQAGTAYNAATDLIGRNLAAGRADKLAFIDDRGQYTFGNLAERTDRFASALGSLGIDMERAEHNAEILEKVAVAYLVALCAEGKARKIPLLVREIAFAKLKADEAKAAKGGNA